MMLTFFPALMIGVAVGLGVWALGHLAERLLDQALGLDDKADADLSDFDRAMARAMREDDEALY